MPDISMCPSADCPVRILCRRNEASGTRPSEWRQAWIAFAWRRPGSISAPVECEGYWRIAALPAEAAAQEGQSR